MNAIIPISALLLATTGHRSAEDMARSFRDDFEIYEDGKWSPEGARHVLQHTLPSRPVVDSALDAIQRDLDTEPPLDKRLEIVGIMLDVQGVTASDDYIRFLAHKLGSCGPRKTETRLRERPWFSLTVITRTIDEVLSELRPEQGRPIPAADILDIAGKHASALVDLRKALTKIDKTIVRLNRIVEGGPDDDDWDLE